MWRLSRVYAHVDIQPTLLSEYLLTHIALEESFSCLDSYLGLYIVGFDKSFLTNIACVWLFTRMDQDVFSEVAGTTERLIADVRGVRLFVSAAVVHM